jgi:hypothetical protein
MIVLWVHCISCTVALLSPCVCNAGSENPFTVRLLEWTRCGGVFTVLTHRVVGVPLLPTPLLVCHTVQADPSEYWRGLVGRAAPLFPGVASAVPPGPWKPFHEQLAWVLLLLALKANLNRQLMARLQRATLAPLASQLEAAEKYAAAAAAAEQYAAVAAAGEAGQEGGAAGSSQRPSRSSSSGGGGREAGPPPTTAAAAGGAPTRDGVGLPVTGGELHTPTSAAAAGAASAAGGVPGHSSSRGSSSVAGAGCGGSSYRSGASVPPPGSSPHVLEEDTDEFAMLQQEVAFLQLQGSLQHPTGH